MSSPYRGTCEKYICSHPNDHFGPHFAGLVFEESVVVQENLKFISKLHELPKLPIPSGLF